MVPLIALHCIALHSLQEDQRRSKKEEGGSDPQYYSSSTSQQQHHHHHNSQAAADDVVQERMPLCIGICVLLAIVYVLSRTGDRDALLQTQGGGGSYHHTNVRGNPPVTANNNGSVLTPTTTTTSQQQQQQQQQQQPAYPDTYSVPTTASTTSTTTSSTSCNCPDLDNNNNNNDLLATLREQALAKSPPHIIECAAAKAGKSQAACHLPHEQRYAALQQKGATLWMTGCSGAGKTTIATALEDQLVKLYGKHVYRLDGDNLRTGLNRDLGFSEADRAESVRRTGELATLFADAGVITLVGLISPYRADRDAVRKRHEDQGIPFYEVFLDVPVEELKKRDPKGQYARVESGELKHFTCIDDPYEEPLRPEITLKTHELKIEESVAILFRQLERDGVLMGAPKVTPPGLPNPDGDVLVDLHVSEHLRAERTAEAATLPKVRITDIDLNWLQTI